MNNTVLNIVNKKQNLSYPLIFKKIAKYFWSEKQVVKRFKNINPEDIFRVCVQQKWYRIVKVFSNKRKIDFLLHNMHLENVKSFQKLGLDLHADNELLLRYVCSKGYRDIIKYLVEKGADIHVKNEEPLLNAIKISDFETVKYLVKKGADIHVKNNLPLRTAMEYKQAQMVEYFMKISLN